MFKSLCKKFPEFIFQNNSFPINFIIVVVDDDFVVFVVVVNALGFVNVIVAVLAVVMASLIARVDIVTCRFTKVRSVVFWKKWFVDIIYNWIMDICTSKQAKNFPSNSNHSTKVSVEVLGKVSNVIQYPFEHLT